MDSSEDSHIDFMPELQRAMTSGSVSITPEMFQAMYLAPENRVKGDLRRTFGNPTPIGLGGFLMAYTPITIAFMGWRGAGADGTATVGTFYYFGGLLAILSCIGHWILGNSFPSTFFGVYGSFFLYYGATLTPWFNAAESLGGPTNPTFLASNAYVGLFMGIFSIYCTICALRVNVLFVISFCLLTPTFLIFSAGQFYGAGGDFEKTRKCTVAAGAVGFPAALIGWYQLLEIMLSTVDFPIILPVGDLSTVIPSRTDLRRARRYEKESDASSV